MSGERENDRRIKDTLIRDMVREGVTPKRAEESATKAVRQMDERLREQGKR